MYYDIILIILSLIIINYAFLKSETKCNKCRRDYIIVKKDTKKIPNIKKLRSDVCYLNKYKHCPGGSYKQCTNNIKISDKCDCNELRGFELCPLDNNTNIRLSEDNYDNLHILDNQKVPINNTRVNKFLSFSNKFNIKDN